MHYSIYIFLLDCVAHLRAIFAIFVAIFVFEDYLCFV